ncbi:MAG TPA: hypothetical protein VJB14_03210 [Planctomycetota bacterium]|nr:hypothetical protein [Planctomycetota bacterium]
MTTLMALLALAAQGKLDWKKDHDAALKEASKAGRYVVVHFSGPN